MRRLIRFFATAGAAALLVLILQSVLLHADLVTLPKTWSVGEILTSSDLNAEFAAVLAQVNGNLSDANVKASAAIKGSKLADAPDGVPTGKINDLAVTAGKLALGASVAGHTSDATSSINFTNTETVLLDIALTTRGGPLRVNLCTAGSISKTASGVHTDAITYQAREDGTAATADGSVIGTAVISVTGTDLVEFPVSTCFPLFVTGLSAGSHRMKLTAVLSSGAAFTGHAQNNTGVVEEAS